MRACGIAVLVSVLSVVFLFNPFATWISLPADAQQPVSTAGASPATALPADVQAKLDRLQADLKAAQNRGDAKAQAKTLDGIGDLYFGVSAYQQALDNYNQALPLARAAKEPALEAAALNGAASCYRTESSNENALQAYQQALDAATAANDVKDQAIALDGLGWVNDNMGQFQKGLDLHNRALALAEQVKDPELEAQIFNRIGAANDNLGENTKALDFYNRALANWRAANDSDGEAKALNNIGIVYAELEDAPKALDYLLQTLPLYRQAGDRAGEAGALNNIGILYKNTGDEGKALDYFRQALPLLRALGNRKGEAAVLNNTGNVYSQLGENQQALSAFNQSLAIRQSLNDPVGEAGILHNISGVLVQQGEMQKALEALQKALALWITAGERRGEADTLNGIGVVYDDLGQSRQALDYYQRALAMYQDLDDRDGQATALLDIAGVYNAPDQEQQALEYYNQALQLERAVHNRDGEARTLNNMGLAYEDLGQKQKALENYQQALPIWRGVGNRDGEAQALNNIGSLLSGSGEKDQAQAYFAQALPLARAVGDPLREAQIFHNMMLAEKTAQPAPAVFYGKQAVNLLQHVRGQIQGLDPALQKSFLASKTEYYHDLAALLIQQGRLPEAQQVLDLLKQQEYSDYVRGDPTKTLSPLTLTHAEKQAQEDYQKSTAQVVELGEQWSALKKMSTRTPEQDRQYQQITEQLNAASKGLNDYYARLYALFANNSDANKQVADVKGDVSLLKQAIAKMQRTVALYTLVGKERYSVIVITGSTAVAREYAITEKDLNRKVAAFQQALRDSHGDAKPPAQELYKILIGPVQADLDQAQAQTLVWSLDGVLRYVPMAALYDGKQYVVEKYATVTITPVSIAHLTEKPDFSNLNAAAMGISRKYEDALPALPAVAGELDEVVNDAQAEGAQGVLPGTILLNGAFTEKAMENLLSGPHTVVHIASHFVFRPGDDSQSYLLLAGKDQDTAGYHMTVAEFRDDQQLSLDETDLLTLSACETGMSGSASNGREVDGLGTTAQLKGAKAVISSLWEVNDSSTGALMADFYKRWAGGEGKVAKAEALREAQLDLLLGKVTPQPGTSGRGVSVAEEPSKPAGPAGYAHPYYWAPFVLMGNWR